MKVILTASAEQFVGKLTFSSLSGFSVFQDLWSEGWSEHVALGNWADLFIIAPATSQTIFKLAHGSCDNALTAVYLAANCPTMIAPAMDSDMFQHPRVQNNLSILKKDGVFVLPTEVGYLASGLEGPGRMLEPEQILNNIEDFFSTKVFKDVNILISAGPTREAIDPVRYISNYSTGKMGYALAEKAIAQGAKVTLVSGPTSLTPPSFATVIPVESGEEMFNAMTAHAPDQDIIIMSAAVSDYAPEHKANQKIKKSTDHLSLNLKKTRDILATLGKQKRANQLLIGFALETHDEVLHAKEKLVNKNLDLIVLNSLKNEGAGFGHNTNKVTLIDVNGKIEDFPLESKKEVAEDILNRICSLKVESIY